jgi:hypothetical protein
MIEPCELCEGEPSTHRCAECEQSMCASCERLHAKQKASRGRGHRVSELRLEDDAPQAQATWTSGLVAARVGAERLSEAEVATDFVCHPSAE